MRSPQWGPNIFGLIREVAADDLSKAVTPIQVSSMKKTTKDFIIKYCKILDCIFVCSVWHFL